MRSSVGACGRSNAAASKRGGPKAALRASGALALSLVAEDKGAIVGHVAISPATMKECDAAWHALGPIAVSPERQGQGVGGALIETALARMRAAGSAGVVLVGDPNYYRRFGFSDDHGAHCPGAPAAYFVALAFDDRQPCGAVAFHEAFGDQN